MRFSIIMATHNNEKTLERAAMSILTQTDADLELLIIDDGSNDQTGAILTQIADEDERVRAYTQVAAGVSVARNRGLQEASGDYVMFVDADDWLEPASLARLAKALGTHPDVLIFNCYNVSGDGTQAPANAFGSEDDWTSAEALKRIYYYCATQFVVNWPVWYGSLHNVWGRCYRREFLTEGDYAFVAGLAMSEDWCFNLAVFAGASSVSIRNLYLYNYYENANSVMHTAQWRGHKAYMRGFTAIASQLESSGSSRTWLPYIAFDQLHDEILLVVNSRLGIIRGAAEIRRLCRTEEAKLAIKGINAQRLKRKNQLILSWIEHGCGVLLWASFYYRYRLKAN